LPNFEKIGRINPQKIKRPATPWKGLRRSPQVQLIATNNQVAVIQTLSITILVFFT